MFQGGREGSGWEEGDENTGLSPEDGYELTKIWRRLFQTEQAVSDSKETTGFCQWFDMVEE